MLLTIHNLPCNTQYSDIKELINSKCNLNEVIIGNLCSEGNSMKATVGVANESEASLVYAKLNGMYIGGLQLFIEDKRQSKVPSKMSTPTVVPPVYYNQMPYFQQNNPMQYQPNYRVDYQTFQNNMSAMNQMPMYPYNLGYNTGIPRVMAPQLDNKTYEGYGNQQQLAGPSQTLQYPTPVQKENNSTYSYDHKDNRSYDRDDRRSKDKSHPSPWAESDRNNKNKDNRREMKRDRNSGSSRDSRYSHSSNKEPNDPYRIDKRKGKRPHDRDEMPSSSAAKYSRSSPVYNSRNESLSNVDSCYSNYIRKMAEKANMEKAKATNRNFVEEQRFGDRNQQKPIKNTGNWPVKGKNPKKIYMNKKYPPNVKIQRPKDKTPYDFKDNARRCQATTMIADELLRDYGIKQPNRKTVGFTEMKITIRTRLNAILGDNLGVGQDEMIDMYKNKFPLHTDENLFILYQRGVDKKVFATQPAVLKLCFLEKKKRFAPPNQGKDHKDKSKRNQSNVSEADTWRKVPNQIPPPALLKPDKQAKREQKQQVKREFLGDEVLELPPITEKVLDEELSLISSMYLSQCKGNTPEENEVASKIRKNCANYIDNVIRLQVTKRLLNIKSNLSLRIFPRGKKLNREELAMFLMNYGVISLKKSERGKVFYIAECDSYESYDKLLTSGDIVMNSETRLTAKPLHITMPRKYMHKRVQRKLGGPSLMERKEARHFQSDNKEKIELIDDDSETNEEDKYVKLETFEKSEDDDVILVGDGNSKEIIDVDTIKSSEGKDGVVLIVESAGESNAIKEEQKIDEAAATSVDSDSKNVINKIASEVVSERNVPENKVTNKNVSTKYVTDENTKDENVLERNVSGDNVLDENSDEEEEYFQINEDDLEDY